MFVDNGLLNEIQLGLSLWEKRYSASTINLWSGRLQMQHNIKITRNTNFLSPSSLSLLLLKDK